MIEHWIYIHNTCKIKAGTAPVWVRVPFRPELFLGFNFTTVVCITAMINHACLVFISFFISISILRVRFSAARLFKLKFFSNLESGLISIKLMSVWFPVRQACNNRPYSYPRHWTGTSLKWRLVWGNIIVLKKTIRVICKHSPH